MKRAKWSLVSIVIVVWLVVTITILSSYLMNPSILSRSKNTNSISNNSISMPLSSSSSEMLVANVAPFAWKFFSQMVLERPENILVSPLSIAACLSMIWSGVTRSSQSDIEFQSLFQLPSEQSIPTLLNVLLKKESNNDNQMLSMSNSLWTSGEVDTKYVEEVSSFASIQPLPISLDPINDWVAKETNNHIPKLFSSEDSSLDPNTLAIAINAIHFQGLWATPFDNTHTQPDTFTTFDDQQTYTANFMSKTIHTSLAQDVSSLGGASVLTLDYACPDAQQQQQCSSEESEFCAMLVLPKHNTVQSMNQVIQGFTKQVSSSSPTTNNNNKPLSNLYFPNDSRKQNVHISLPRFELKQGPESLKKFMKDMGFETAFSTEKNQFLRMTPNRHDTYLDDVIAAATMKVTEEGTVATASTAAIMMTRSLPPSIEFNRPFLFMVLHRPTGTPLFLSQVHNPDFI